MLRYLRLLSLGSAIIGGSALLSSCDKDMSISLSNDNEEALTLNALDSMTISLTTIMMPNIPTSGAGAILLGGYERPGIGSMSSSAFFQVAPSDYDYSSIPAGARFDSIKLDLRTHGSRYFYGDTTVQHKIRVHRITKPLATTTLTAGGIHNLELPFYVDGPAIFAEQAFDYDATPLGELTYVPRPRAGQQLSVKLDNAFGQDLFEKMVTSSSQVTSASNFVSYVNGLAVLPDEDNKSIIAYNDTIATQIYYSYVGSDGFRTTGSRRLVINDYELKYNRFTSDRTGTAYESLQPGQLVSAQQTAGQSFLQGGTGVGARIDIPALREFMQMEDIAVNKVELEVEVATTNETQFPLPMGQAAPMLMIASATGVPNNFVRSPMSTNPQFGRYTPGNNTGRNAKYTFDLIEYVRTLNNPDSFNNHLVLAVGPPALFSTVNSAVIATENNKPKIKLTIFYTKFK